MCLQHEKTFILTALFSASLFACKSDNDLRPEEKRKYEIKYEIIFDPLTSPATVQHFLN
ncbi:hypothetical protein D3C80_561940 [compost metagenome]